jgi:hypothetical protein
MPELRKTESGVEFCFDAQDAIDGDAWIRAVDGAPSCDFVWRHRDRRGGDVVDFIEAKSSSPNPASRASGARATLDEYCGELRAKLLHTAVAVLASHARRGALGALPARLAGGAAPPTRWRFVLIIPRHRDEWLSPLRDALREALRAVGMLRICCVDPDPIVLNAAQAIRTGFICPPG